LETGYLRDVPMIQERFVNPLAILTKVSGKPGRGS